VSHDTNTSLQGLIERLQQGDDSARRPLLERAYARMRRLAGAMLHRSFPELAARHELDSIVNETWLRLLQALETTHPPTVADFFRFAAHKTRQVLLDMVERQGKLQQREITGLDGRCDDSHSIPAYDSPNATYDPARLALWTEFHQKVATLSEEERSVFDLHYYLDLPQSEIAKLLNLHPRKVSYLWVAATEKLAEGLANIEGML